ncbi:hypothetical protein [Bacteroides acidifaciens]|uniref:hypothetical protein n=1 Tax=Bacteroides acidifaciens TaxID=85831 RepID=UPI0025B1FC12|nr:hypothetical protein [Bacteroides acidifaciens]
MAKKKKTVEQELAEYKKDIVSQIKEWEDINENGCNDPCWQDGMNMNLVRHHVIYDKVKIAEICEENNLPLPSEYFLPTPPSVENSYMANLKQTSRVERIRQFGGKITTDRAKFNKQQLSFV